MDGLQFAMEMLFIKDRFFCGVGFPTVSPHSQRNKEIRSQKLGKAHTNTMRSPLCIFANISIQLSEENWLEKCINDFEYTQD